jgi:hypothetical protein
MKRLAMGALLCIPAWAIPGSPSTTPSLPPIPNMQLPNAAWLRIQGVVVRPVEGGLWYARTNGRMPVGSILSVRRQGTLVNGARVMESDLRGIFLEPWAHDAIQPGDQLHLESVAP